MTASSTPCVYAVANLKRNSTRLVVAMCIGIVVSLYAIYLQARVSAGYDLYITKACHWLMQHMGVKSASLSSSAANGGNCWTKTACAKTGSRLNPFAAMYHHPTSGLHRIMRRLAMPMVSCTTLLNGLINAIQIIVLKVCCKSIAGTNAIIGMSAFGMVLSSICMISSMFSCCKLLCLSCFSLQHVAIIYFACRRRCIIRNMMCPSENLQPPAGSGCSFLSSSASSPAKKSPVPSIGPITSANDARRRRK